MKNITIFLTLLLLAQQVIAYKRPQFDQCVIDRCSVQKEVCRLDFECSSTHLDYLNCIGVQDSCKGSYPDDEYSSRLMDCMVDCNMDSSNENYVKLQKCLQSCNSTKIGFLIGSILALLIAFF